LITSTPKVGQISVELGGVDVFTAFMIIFAAVVLGVLACVVAYVLGWVINYGRYDPRADYEAIRQKCPTAVLVFAGKSAQTDPPIVDIGTRPSRFQSGKTPRRTDDSTTPTPA